MLLKSPGSLCGSALSTLDHLLSVSQTLRYFDEPRIGSLKRAQSRALGFENIRTACALKLGPLDRICVRAAGSFPKLSNCFLVLLETRDGRVLSLLEIANECANAALGCFNTGHVDEAADSGIAFAGLRLNKREDLV